MIAVRSLRRFAGALAPGLMILILGAAAPVDEKALNPGRIEDIQPKPLPPIPDDPPPHEGALIDYPIVVEPPDLLIVEALEALPGRPISGERLVRPDGTISLGFYGNVHVRGLSLEQVKAKIVLHLRSYLNDEILGLTSYVTRAEAEARGFEIIEDEGGHQDERAAPEAGKAEDKSAALGGARPESGRMQPRLRKAARRTGADDNGSAAVDEAEEEGDEAGPESAEPTIRIPSGSKVTITIEPIDPPAPLESTGAEKPAPEREVKPKPEDEFVNVRVPAVKSDRVFVDVVAYNSKHYYVLGDVGSPGRLVVTGRDTVLEALGHAGGFLPTADTKTVQLVRPQAGGRPAKVYPIDYEAIVQRGQVATNYQLFPGDRIVVKRNPTVEAMVELDRVSALNQSAQRNILTYAETLKRLREGAPEMSRAALESVIVDWTAFWLDAARQPTDPNGFRERLIRKLAPQQ